MIVMFGRSPLGKEGQPVPGTGASTRCGAVRDGISITGRAEIFKDEGQRVAARRSVWTPTIPKALHDPPQAACGSGGRRDHKDRAYASR
jgi:hypothetical protein